MSTKLGKYNNDKVMIFAGQAGQSLGLNICENLDRPLGRAEVGRFSDNEIKVEILEHVRGHDVFIVQSTHQPVNDNLMELIIMADALRRASAKRISAVVPYFGYARQDRRVRSARVPITAKIVADMMTTVGIDRVLTVDLHADQIQGFFNIPVDNVYGSTVLIEDLLQRVKPEDNPIVVSPDVGGVVRARAIAKRVYDSDLAIIDKRRDRANESEVMNVLGDVNDKTCVIVDDMVDTAGTLCQAAFALKEAGARKVLAYCTHPVLSGNAVKTITDSELDECVVANTISLSPEAEKCDKIRQLNLAGMLSEAIFRIHTSESLSSMFP